jgi:hypothetical protein
MTETAGTDQPVSDEPVSDHVLAQDVQMNAGQPVQEVAPPLEGAVSFKLAKALNLGQFEAELRDAAGLKPDAHFAVVLTGPDQANEPISTENPAQLWVLPASIDGDLVTKTIGAHNPSADWGVTAAQKAYNDVWAKIIADPEVKLTPAEVRALSVGTALRLNAQEAVSSGNV